MVLSNPWRDCRRDPPIQYVRVEIRDIDHIHYVGYRYKKDYYETIGNYIIQNPKVWRKIPQGSYLFEEIRQKIFNSNKVSVALEERGKNYEQDNLRSI